MKTDDLGKPETYSFYLHTVGLLQKYLSNLFIEYMDLGNSHQTFPTHENTRFFFQSK